jgi:1-deoxy-D-xylulose-5-phosphate reductoisomerase
MTRAAGAAPAAKGVALLGSTGSIGTSALKVLGRHRDRFTVAALTAHSNSDLLAEQVGAFHPGYVGIVEPKSGTSENGQGKWRTGVECLVEAATCKEADIVINAVVGAAGLDATLAALDAGKRVALANKETLVLAGELVEQARKRGNADLIPVDSEHSAILQCIAARPSSEVRRIILTASGGPFREWDAERLASATITEALRHPTWRMGKKVTVDSATLANKALEVIEAHFLFGIPYDRIEVVVHPQSVVHSFVEFIDGSVLAQLGVPSMELPILYALTHPGRLEDSGVPSFDPVALSPMTFEKVDEARFPALRLGIEAGKRGGAAPAVFNGANECAVAAFLAGRITFTDIHRGISSALDAYGDNAAKTKQELLAADASARRHVTEMFKC